MLDTPDERKHLLLEDVPLVEALQAPPSGEPRVPMFHVTPGRETDFEACARSELGETFALLTTAEAGDIGLFGPDGLDERTAGRVGQYVALSDAPQVLIYGPERASIGRLRGFHAGLTPNEMRIPLIVAGA